MTDDRNELVENVVHMQLSSANFAEYCVAHVTDPKHRFLFVDDNNNADRRLYVRLLQEQQLNRKSHTTTTTTNTTPVQTAEGLSTDHNNKNNNNKTAMLWASLIDYFASPNGVHGPHMPHMFRSERDLTTYIEMLQHVEHSHESREQTVQYMLQRMPMTETFLYSLWYLCDAQVNAAHTLKQTRNSNNNNNNNNISSGSGSAAGHSHPIQTTTTTTTTTTTKTTETTGDDAALQSAATLLFIANALLLEHEAVERPGRYRAVFNAYIPRMVELLARSAPPTSQVALYVQKTVSVWAMEGTFTGDALQRMQHAVG